MAQTLQKHLKKFFHQKGFEIVQIVRIEDYNAIVPPHLHLPTNSQHSTVGFLLGTTKSLWPKVIQYYRTTPFQDILHPLYHYFNHVEKQLYDSTIPSPSDVYWSHDTSPGRLIAIQKMCVVAGLAELNEISHLCVHKTYGPWFALQGLLIYDQVDFPQVLPELPQLPESPLPIVDPEHLQALIDRAVEKRVRKDKDAWKAWLDSRMALAGPSHPYMYPKEQILYHYNARRPEVLQRILRACVASQSPVSDYLVDDPNEQVRKCRQLIQQVLKETVRNYKPDGIFLSGGLDTSVLMEMTDLNFEELQLGIPDTSILAKSVKGAITIQADASGTDRKYAQRICGRFADIKHHDVVKTIPEVLHHAKEVCKLIESFDPMEIRNSIVIMEAIDQADQAGYKCIVTGDGADELYAGYSFFHSMTEEQYLRYRQHLRKIMRFTGSKLAASRGIEIVSPFLSLPLVNFAMELGKDDLIGMATPIATGETHGKLILRQACPEASSQWRTKEPIEVGAGTTTLRKGYFDTLISEEEFKNAQQEVFKRDDVILRDAEHLYFYREFLKAFNGSISNVPGPRYGLADDTCPGCNFVLLNPDQDYCVTCGFWPARITEANSLSSTKALDELDKLKLSLA